jgi:hypothetical protein
MSNTEQKWKLVPVEPTAAMNNAGSYCQLSENGLADEIYAAMLAASPPPAALGVDAAFVERVFDMGYAWRGMLQGQTLEDSRAVGRTLGSDIFDGLPINVDVIPSFETADIGACIAKAEIKRALVALLPQPSPEVAAAPSVSGVREMLASFGQEEFREGSRADYVTASEWEDYLEVPLSVLEKIRASLASEATPVASALPDDVVRLVIAARVVAYGDPTPEETRELDKASEAFADRVPWDDEPEPEGAAPKEAREPSGCHKTKKPDAIP